MKKEKPFLLIDADVLAYQAAVLLCTRRSARNMFSRSTTADIKSCRSCSEYSFVVHALNAPQPLPREFRSLPRGMATSISTCPSASVGVMQTPVPNTCYTFGPSARLKSLLCPRLTPDVPSPHLAMRVALDRTSGLPR